MMLADATPDPKAFLQFWIIIGFIGQVLLSVITIIVLLANRKQKREVSFEFTPASKEEFEKQKQHCTDRHAQLFQGIEEVQSGTSTSLDHKLSDVKRELTSQGKSIAGLEKETQIQNQTLAGVTTDIKRILERLPRRS